MTRTGADQLAADRRGRIPQGQYWAFSWMRWRVLRHLAGRLLWASGQAGPGRPLGGGRIGLAAYVACSACGRLADAGPGG